MKNNNTINFENTCKQFCNNINESLLIINNIIKINQYYFEIIPEPQPFIRFKCKKNIANGGLIGGSITLLCTYNGYGSSFIVEVIKQFENKIYSEKLNYSDINFNKSVDLLINAMVIKLNNR